MNKIDKEYMVNSFDQSSNEYKDAALNVGLWNSEHDLILKYTTNFEDNILDMGCGAGRCAFGIEKLGFKSIDAIDFSPKMISAAKQVDLTSHVNFEVGDCTAINKADNTYDFAIFSFNGLMQIPMSANRLKALNELKRVVKKNQHIIFTTHDRSQGTPKYLELWRQEEIDWNNGDHDLRLHEFGDVITHDDNDVEYFIHIPTYDEVVLLIEAAGLELVDSFIRSSRYRENKRVYDFSDNCRFWIVKNNK